MKKLFYFSSSKLQYIEVKNFKKKIFLYFTVTLLVLMATIYGTLTFISEVTGSGKSVSALKKENNYLQNKLQETVSVYKDLDLELDSLKTLNNTLRIASNLPPISNEERKVGVGGGYFDNNVDFLKDNIGSSLKDALSYIDEVKRKVEFEKSEYVKISDKLKENKKLFACIPAIKPCSGDLGDGFGMRRHPILNINIMHEGVDIITDVGTPIYAAGNGSVDFVGTRGGYGLCVEINHGFGYKTVYGHLSRADVKEGQEVKRGFEIEESGSSGLSTGPHLHYEVEHDGVKLNPENFFFDDLDFFAVASKN